MKSGSRTIRYGAAGVLVLAGVVCGALVPGTAGGTLATVLVGIGLVIAVSLVFYDIGLSEDRDRDRAEHAGPPRPKPERRDEGEGPPAPHGSDRAHDASHSPWPTGRRRPRHPRR